LYLDGPALPEQRNCSEHTAEVIDTEVRRLLDEARARVSETLTAHRATLDRLAGVLLEKEVVDRLTLDALLRSAGSKPSSVPSTAATTT
jgi:cell division protease FtsH